MKYPKTFYFSFSPSVDREDVRETGYFNTEDFIGKDIIITVKMDGSNCSMTREKIAARNGNHAHGISFDMAKSLHASIAHAIPPQNVIFGEWLYAKHSIHYTALDSYFQVFAVYDTTKDIWMPWTTVLDIANQIGLNTVEYSEIYNFTSEREIEFTVHDFGEKKISEGQEGLVVRCAHEFKSNKFKNNVAKYVRKNHVQTAQHWSKQKLIRNILK